MTIQFDNVGKLLSYNNDPEEGTPPMVDISWGATHARNSVLRLNFGGVGAGDAIRVMGDQAITVQNKNNGCGFSGHSSNFVGPDGSFYDVFRNSDRMKSYIIAVANFNAPNFLKRSMGNVFYETEKSGGYILGRARESGFSKILAGHLEDSSVDMVSEIMTIKQAQNEIQVLLSSLEK